MHSLVQQISKIVMSCLQTTLYSKTPQTLTAVGEGLVTLAAQVMGLSVSIIGACAPVRGCRFCIALESDCYFEGIWLKTLVILVI